MEDNAGKLGVSRACDALNIRRQGYYEWRQRGRRKRARRDKELTVLIKNVFFENDRIYGARKIRSELRKAGVKAGRGRISRLMDAAGLTPVTRRKMVNTTDSKHSLGVFPNLLQQDFSSSAPDRVWVSDFTYIATDEGWLYLCSIMDLYSRRIVGWAVSAKIDRRLAIKAFEQAVANRGPKQGFILHTDRGSQYASQDFRNEVEAAGGLQSMSRSGKPGDNACAESFFKSLKVEAIDRRHFNTREQAGAAVAQYMLFYNHKRIHATLGYLSPSEYEALALLPTAS